MSEPIEYLAAAVVAVSVAWCVREAVRFRRLSRSHEWLNTRLTQLLHDAEQDRGYTVINRADGVRRNRAKWS